MKKIILLTVCIFSLIFVNLSTAKSDKNVIVVNEPTVHVDSLPDVTVSGTADVNVTNDDSNPVPVAIQGKREREPVLLSFRARDSDFSGFRTLFLTREFTMCIGSTPVCEDKSDTDFIVPENRQMVINEISFRARVLFGSQPATVSARINVYVAGSSLFPFSIGLLDLKSPGLNIWEKGVPMNVRVPSGSRLTGRIEWSGFGAEDVEGSMTISGEWVSTP